VAVPRRSWRGDPHRPQPTATWLPPPNGLRDASIRLLRFRLFDLPARLTHRQRKRWLHLRADWPWIDAAIGTWTQVNALPTMT
jgi:hypothetical protein